jgi:hypothetical protein
MNSDPVNDAHHILLSMHLGGEIVYCRMVRAGLPPKGGYRVMRISPLPDLGDVSDAWIR